MPRSRLYRSVRTGEVRVNSGRSRQTYRLREGDRVRLPPLQGGGGSDAPGRVADLGVVGDIETVIPALTQALEVQA